VAGIASRAECQQMLDRLVDAGEIVQCLVDDVAIVDRLRGLQS
jgi:hypothetical protein